MSEREEEVDRTKTEKSVEGEKQEMDGTESREESERMAVTDAPVRKSERERQPPRRLDYPELRNPLVTVVKSFLHGLTTVLSNVLNEDQVVSAPFLPYTPQIKHI